MADTNKAPSSPAGKASQPAMKRNASSPKGYGDGNKNMLMAAIGMFLLFGVVFVWDQVRAPNEEEIKLKKEEEQEAKRVIQEEKNRQRSQQQRVEMLKRQQEAAAKKAAGGH